MKRMKKLEEDYSKIKVKCKCGHILTIPVYIDKLICNWCGRLVHNNSKSYFKYKIRKEVNYEKEK